MVGPFMQGMLLMGVIYWYSKGMINMINEYYRSEFQKQLETNPASKKPASADDIELLLKKQMEEIHEPVFMIDSLQNELCPVNHEPDVCFNETELQKFLGLTLFVCFDNNLKLSQNEMEKHFKDCQRSELVQVESLSKR